MILSRVFPAAALLAALALGAMAQAGEPQPRVLTISGEGEATAAPDMAMISFGVMVREGDARMAVEQVAQKMTAVMGALQDQGVEARDVQTDTLSLNPVYQHFDKQSRPPEIVGYEARNRVTVKLRDLSMVGAAVDAVSAAGVTEFGGVRFGFADPRPLRDAALQDAVADATRKARLIAAGAGVTLGAPQQIHVGGFGGGQPEPYADMVMMRAESASMPVASGESTIRANISITYAIE